ncbi:MAG TPA: hypothetical protein VF510_21990, partial [Ktedonobacterales bacterium]
QIDCTATSQSHHMQARAYHKYGPMCSPFARVDRTHRCGGTADDPIHHRPPAFPDVSGRPMPACALLVIGD